MKQNLVELLYTTWIHNDFAIACAFGALVSLLLLFRRPSRFGILLLVGFAVLFLRFQYLKHIVEPLLDQTTGVLLRDENAGRGRSVFVLLNVLVPFGMYILGWGSLFAAIFLAEFRKKKIAVTHHDSKDD